MDLPEEEDSLPCDSPNEYTSPGTTVVDAEVQLGLNHEVESGSLEAAFQENLSGVNMKLPLTVQNCLPPGIQVSSELLVITNSGSGFLNEQKVPITTFHSEGIEPQTKRLCIEQDGQTYILALQDNLDTLSGVVELPSKDFASLDASQVLSFQEQASLHKDGINQNWFTSREEKVTLHSKGHIWKQGMWAKEEIDLLEKNIELYCKDHDISNPATIVFEMAKDERKDFYRTIAKGLNRPLFSVYRRVIRMYDNKNHVGKYTSEELELLKKLRSIHGNDWQAIGAVMGRSASSIKDRCRLMKDNCNQGKWLPAEERRLAEAVYDMTNALPGEMISSGLSWATVADRVGTRSEKQCRTKWLNYLNWKVAGGTEWTRDDDITLILRVYAYNVSDENDVDWTELSKGWLSVRSPQWLRGKWWTLKRQVPKSNDVSFQETCECLYQHFVLKQKVKEEVIMTDAIPSNLDLQVLLNRPKNILQSPSLSSNTPIVVSTAQVCSSPVVSLTNAHCIDMVNSALTSVPVGSVLQTLEVLPQNIHLTGSPQTFLLTSPAQQSLPLTAALPTSQIIIQTLTPNNLHSSGNIQINPSPHIIINASNSPGLTSLASTQIPSAPSSPTSPMDVLREDKSTLILESHYRSQGIDDNSMHPDTDIEADHENIDSKSNIILSDPMLAANGSPEPLNSDVELEKHSAEDHLDVTHN